MDEIHHYEIEFAELRYTGKLSIHMPTLVASWHVVLDAHTAEDALVQFKIGWRHWREWEPRTNLGFRSIKPVTERYRQKLYEPDFVDLVDYQHEPPLWKDSATRTSPGDPI